ncbi:hypothetical protein ZWY2020_035106 [Hordeum vulgare]|nr:hypothetical protein ZWY2020_035106 [Hordeum vulgare]
MPAAPPCPPCTPRKDRRCGIRGVAQGRASTAMPHMRAPEAPGRGPDYLDGIPDDLVLSIFSKLAASATSPSDLLSVYLTYAPARLRVWCKRLNGLGQQDMVFAKARCAALPASEPAAFTSADAGNLEACYILGMINPDRYGDSHPHFYTRWTRDNYDATGCYNTDCPGYIRVDGAVIAPGDAIHPVSNVPHGPRQSITLRVLKDKKSGDWWVYCGFNKSPTGVGYFPRSLFSYLAEKADGMQFGAFVKSKKALPTPPMGSGALPNSGKGRAASFTDIRFIDQDGNSSPIKEDLPMFVTENKCHSITHIEHAKCFYGGPGGCMR